jgi:hypothetical protein
MLIEYKTFLFHSPPTTNRSRSFTVDIVMVYDAELFVILDKMTAPDYFNNKKLLSRENPFSISIFSIEILPGKTYLPFKVPIESKKKLINCIIFSDLPLVKTRCIRKVLTGDVNKISIIFDENGIKVVKI